MPAPSVPPRVERLPRAPRDRGRVPDRPGRGLHVLLTVDPEIPVPPTHYGGIERIVDMLARGLRRRGHEVTLLAHPGSTTPARLIPYEGTRSRSILDTARHLRQVRRAVAALGVDIVHSFARLAYLLPILPTPLPKIQSYQRAITPRSVRCGRRLSRGSLTFTACSASCAASGRVGGGRWRVIPNGVAAEKYDFVDRVPFDAPLVFLGRLERIKGPHLAIEVARRAGRRLVIAGNAVRDGGEAEEFFHREIRPHLDGERVLWIGPVDDGEKNRLLGSAAALLMPITWEEPFGIVMAEALACGTPVLAFPRGAAPEVVEPGVNGFLCPDVPAMVEAVARLGQVSRNACRGTFERSFSDSVIVQRYERLYRDRIAERKASRPHP